MELLKPYGPKVSNVISDSARAFMEIVQQDCTLTQTGVLQKLNASGLKMTQSNVSRGI